MSAVLARTTRGQVVEAVHRGHVVALDGQGVMVDCAGEPDTVTTVRSAVKPIQAIPFVEQACDVLGLDDEAVAQACASHNGEPQHLAVVRRMLAAAGVGEDALSCAPHLPYDDASAAALARSGTPPTRLHNNCSGKHAAMLATCRVRGWPFDGYAQPGHPMQRAVADAWREHAGVRSEDAPRGIDGCGLPTLGLPLHSLAAAMLHAARRSAPFRRAQAAMAMHPFAVGGTGRFDTAVLAAAGDVVTVKVGGAAVWCAVARDGSQALVIKLESGSSEALSVVAVEWLLRTGLLTALPAALEQFRRLPLHNWAGLEVGETVAV